MVIIMAKTTQIDDVFGYIEATKKSETKSGNGYHYAFLVQAVGMRAATGQSKGTKPQWYNAYAGTIKAEKYFDSFHKGQLVGINLTDDKDFNNIASIHNASKAKKAVAAESAEAQA